LVVYRQHGSEFGVLGGHLEAMLVEELVRLDLDAGVELSGGGLLVQFEIVWLDGIPLTARVGVERALALLEIIINLF
jgi:hypothetical protein